MVAMSVSMAMRVRVSSSIERRQERLIVEVDGVVVVVRLVGPAHLGVGDVSISRKAQYNVLDVGFLVQVEDDDSAQRRRLWLFVPDCSQDYRLAVELDRDRILHRVSIACLARSLPAILRLLQGLSVYPPALDDAS